jgi:HEAT repeats
MKCCRLLLVGLVLSGWTLPAPGGILFGKHAKPNPAERVPELLAMIKTDPSESKRANAAKELGKYDPAAFPDMIAVLVDVAVHDDKAGVRLEAVQTLGKLRPISQEAGMALEEATHDSSIRVRLQARSSLLGYRLAGYHGAPRPSEPATVSAPPTPNTTVMKPAAPAKRFSIVPMPRTNTGLVNETAPPPLAEPAAAPTEPKKWMASPVPQPSVPKPQTQPADQGPDLPE